jgi:AraC-like DNA-binding protein
VAITQKEVLVTNKELMRIGLIQYHRDGSKESDGEEYNVATVATTQSEELGNGVSGIQQELLLPGATILMRQWSFDNCLVTHHKNPDFCFGIHFVLEGQWEFRCKETKVKLLIKNGTYNLIQWSNIDGSQKLKGEKCISVDIYFTHGFLEDLLGIVDNPVFVHFLKSSGEHPLCLWDTEKPIALRFRELLLEILDCPYKDIARENYIISKVKLLLIDVFLSNESGNRRVGHLPSSDCAAIDKVDIYIKRNLRKKLTIKELSEVAGFNTTKLKGCFKKTHKTTIFKYITRLRMEKAKALILQGNYSIAQASYEVGYSNPQHFTVAFKKNLGYLPSALLGMDE